MFLQFAQAWPQWRLDKITLGKALPVAKHDMVGVKEESATHYQLSNKKKKTLFFSGKHYRLSEKYTFDQVLFGKQFQEC